MYRWISRGKRTSCREGECARPLARGRDKQVPLPAAVFHATQRSVRRVRRSLSSACLAPAERFRPADATTKGQCAPLAPRAFRRGLRRA